jgi:hypothetical protein
VAGWFNWLSIHENYDLETVQVQGIIIKSSPVNPKEQAAKKKQEEEI